MRLSNFLTFALRRFAFASAETENQQLAVAAYFFDARSPLALPAWAPTYFYLVFDLPASICLLEPLRWRARAPRAAAITSGL